MTNLFIGSHYDDVELSCGGLIQKLILKGDHVSVFSLSHVYNNVDLSSEFIASMETLGVELFRYHNIETRCFNANQNHICDLIYEKTLGYDRVFTHDCSDRHDDHRVVAEKVRRVHNASLFTFIAPWNGVEKSNYFVELSEQQLEKKIEALRCYKSQAHRAYMDEDFIRSWARTTGIKCGKKYAEGFHVERLIQ